MINRIKKVVKSWFSKKEKQQDCYWVSLKYMTISQKRDFDTYNRLCSSQTANISIDQQFLTEEEHLLDQYGGLTPNR